MNAATQRYGVAQQFDILHIKTASAAAQHCPVLAVRRNDD